MSEARHLLHSPDLSREVTVYEVGARIASVRDTPSDTEFLFQIEGRPTERVEEPAADSNAHWHRRYAGGWHVLIPHAGDERTIDGVRHPFHGEAAWRRWRTLGVQANACTMELTLDTAPLHLVRTVTVDDTGLRVEQRVRNISSAVVAFTWTEHPAFSPALTASGTTLTVADAAVDVTFPEPGMSHSGFRSLRDLTVGRAALRSARASAELHFDPAVFPFLHVWQEHRGVIGFPWFGEADTIALEPASRGYEATDALGPLVLDPGASVSSALTLVVSADAA